MPYWLYDIIFPVVRWVHLACMTLLVGGTLFFELVLPIAVEDLQKQDKLYVLARARLVFRWVIWISVVGLLASGLASVWRMWTIYQEPEMSYSIRWMVGHIAVGLVAMLIAVLFSIGRRPVEDPVLWMRLDLVILLVTIFMGSATRHFQLALWERGALPDRPGKQAPEESIRGDQSRGDERLTTMPATTRAAGR